ncbi:sigma-70 family RNA polymerase sigma factor [Bacillus sp. DJP31]|uniref:sigma-70 family RNA polymerase sigma factor n=1 Tax=Bacillus sp. DJP31 TaxID=3409789 RepID=UPI003BB5C706
MNNLLSFYKGNTENQEHFSEDELMELYPKLRRYCEFLSQNSWETEDLVQEALLKVWHFYRHKPEVHSALINKIAYNEWIDTLRKRNRESLESIPEEAFNENEQIHNRLETVSTLIKELTPKQSVIITLKEAFLYQNAEIAELLNMTETAVKAIVHRAKQRLEKRKLEGDSSKPFWDETEREHIGSILHRSLFHQDPDILIRAIPFIRSLQKETTPKCTIYQTRRSHSPSNIVYMAA